MFMQVTHSLMSNLINGSIHLVDGGWGEWSAWELCPVSCGGADYSRTRSCDSPAPLYGGKVCPGIAIESRRCNENPCPSKL